MVTNPTFRPRTNPRRSTSRSCSSVVPSVIDSPRSFLLRERSGAGLLRLPVTVYRLQVFLKSDGHHFLQVGLPLQDLADAVLLERQHPALAAQLPDRVGLALLLDELPQRRRHDQELVDAHAPAVAGVEARLAALAARDRDPLAVDLERVEPGIVAELLAQLLELLGRWRIRLRAPRADPPH